MDREDKILYIIKLFSYLSGRNLLPGSTDPKDTYHWRYAAKFLDKMESMEVPWRTIIKIVSYVVEYAKQRRMVRNGINILNRSNTIDIAIMMEKREDSVNASELDNLRRSHNFVQHSQHSLSERVDDGFPNIVLWYMGRNINVGYLALSESCRIVTNTLDAIDRSILPDQSEIVDKRIKYLSNEYLRGKAKLILKDDFIKIIT